MAVWLSPFRTPFLHQDEVSAKRGQLHHADMLDWVGGAFDPTAFDIDTINARLLKLKR
jgi:hypothetical protein